MAIIAMLDNNATEFPEGAVCLLEYAQQARENRYVVVTCKTHVGLCLREYERNGYDDSDFYMVVWNPVENKPESIMFASTRGWSYPCYGSYVDATPEVKEAHAAYERKIERARKAQSIREQRRQEFRMAAAAGVPRKAIVRLRGCYNANTFGGLEKLLTANLRSVFKLSLRQQVIEWLKTENPKYPQPLSPKQAQYI